MNVLTVEVAQVYRVGSRRYFTKRTAISRLAWQMIREKYPDDFLPFERDHETGYFDPPRSDHTAVHARLTRWLSRQFRSQRPSL